MVGGGALAVLLIAGLAVAVVNSLRQPLQPSIDVLVAPTEPVKPTHFSEAGDSYTLSGEWEEGIDLYGVDGLMWELSSTDGLAFLITAALPRYVSLEDGAKFHDQEMIGKNDAKSIGSWTECSNNNWKGLIMSFRASGQDGMEHLVTCLVARSNGFTYYGKLHRSFPSGGDEPDLEQSKAWLTSFSAHL